MINQSTQNYDDDIYANPVRAINNPLDVSGKLQPSVGNYVCQSGGFSKTYCDQRVLDLNNSLCDVDGCTTALFRYNQGGSICSDGDSGAAVFREPSGSQQALIQGQLVGERFVAPAGCLAEKVNGIETILNVTVATSPG